jgi:hypothetical protein
MPEISIESICRAREECSRVKSSTKVSLVTNGPFCLISEEMTPPARPNGLSGCRHLSRSMDKRFSRTHSFKRLMAAPVVWLRS